MSKGNPGVSKLLNSMKKLVREVNDKEICNRLEILMGVEKEDVPATLIRSLFDAPHDFDADLIPEPFSQYAKHFLYMLKREERIHVRDREEKESRKKARRSGRSTKIAGASSTSRKKSVTSRR